MTTREAAIRSIDRYYDDGRFLADLGRRVAIPTESQNPDRAAILAQYVEGEMTESLSRMGFDCKVFPNPSSKYGPFLIATRMEDPKLPTVLWIWSASRLGTSPPTVVIASPELLAASSVRSTASSEFEVNWMRATEV